MNALEGNSSNFVLPRILMFPKPRSLAWIYEEMSYYLAMYLFLDKIKCLFSGVVNLWLTVYIVHTCRCLKSLLNRPLNECGCKYMRICLTVNLSARVTFSAHFTLANTRRLYSSMGDLLANKGLTDDLN